VRVLSIVHEREAGSGVHAQVVRERGDEIVEWIPAQQPAPAVQDFDAALVFGGAMHVDHEGEHPWLRGEKALLRELLAAATPTLGVCLGAQLLADVAGGVVARMAAPEIGWTPVELTPEGRMDPLLGALPETFDAFQWHSYEFSPPAGAPLLARSVACLQAFRLATAPSWGIQFHAEATGETITGWIDDYRSDEDAVRAELDWEALESETKRLIAGWNELGAGICRRFLERAAGLAGS
jgi:GMP synthase-like glutamine amidotransferase